MSDLRGDGRVDRRFFFRRMGVLGGATVLAGVGYAIADEVTGSGGRSPGAPGNGTTIATGAGTWPVTSQRAVHTGALGLPVANWVVEENSRPGTTGWLVSGSPPHGIEGYVDRTSANRGEVVRLYVNTVATSFVVHAYRMGWYRGKGARLVTTFGPVRGRVQPAATVTPGVNMVECPWHESLRFRIGGQWPPGCYLLKLVGRNGYSQWVPLVVRDDASGAAVVVQSAVTSWQAYNLWGGYSLYGTGPGGTGYSGRSRVVSFDRPYPANWENGSADFFGNEYPLVALLERHGVDVTYWTDVDLHERPQLLARHRCLVTLGHDEYWSSSMRSGADAALDRGVNLVFLGANACYRHVRFESSPTGPNRRQVCYKDATEDPLYGHDNAEVTSNWPDGPDPRPECALIGVEYTAYGGRGDLVVADAGSFVFAGTDLRNGGRIQNILGSEFDSYVPKRPSPPNLQILCHSPTPSALGPATADMSYYTRHGGGGVFATGTAAWVNRLWHNDGTLPVPFAPKPSKSTSVASRITLNVIAQFSRGPGSRFHPSSANWQGFYAAGSGTLTPVEAPGH